MISVIEHHPDDAAPAPDFPTREEIAAFALNIYQREGCPEDCAEDYWPEAERRLRRARGLPAYDDIQNYRLVIA